MVGMQKDGISQEQLQALAQDIKNTLKASEIAQLIRLIAPTPSTGEMSAAEFETLMAELKDKSRRRGYSDTSITAARLVLVMGATVAEAAAETNVSRQAIHQVLKRIKRRMESLPENWVQVSTWLPAEIANQLEEVVTFLKSPKALGGVQGDLALKLELKT